LSGSERHLATDAQLASLLGATRMRKGDLPAVVTRREAITATAGIGVAGFILGMKGSAGAKEQAGQLGSKVCVLTPEAVEGPLLFRS
jgi:hypothetical protein